MKNKDTYIPPRLDLLELLIDHLENGKLGHNTFDFSAFNKFVKWDDDELELIDDDSQFEENYYSCGTNGCAMGELPILFPDKWLFVKDEVLLIRKTITSLKSANKISSYDDATLFFQIPISDVYSMFHPYWYDTLSYQDKPMSKDSTKKEVIENMKKYIEYKLNYLDDSLRPVNNFLNNEFDDHDTELEPFNIFDFMRDYRQRHPLIPANK